MRNILLICAALLMTIVANAESRIEGCTVNLEKKSRGHHGFQFVRAFTEYGWNACDNASLKCNRAKYDHPRSYLYQCTKAPVRRPQIQSCQFRIETEFGDTFDNFTFHGPRACETAKRECEKTLHHQRRNGMIHSRAWCVQVFGQVTPPHNPRPLPRPRPGHGHGRFESASCTVDLVAGRRSRRTGNSFTASAQARNHREARQRACIDAMRKCQTQVRGAMRCEERH